MADKKAEILAALDTVDPLPQDLIIELTNATDPDSIRRKTTTWMQRTKDDWKDERKNQPRNDGADIYNALHPNQGMQFVIKETNV